MTDVTFVHGIGNKPEPRALLDLWRRKLAQGAGAIDLGDAGVESTMVYWTDVLYERPDPDLAAFEKRRWGWCGEIPRGSSWDSLPKVRFAPDSPLEGTGFEPSVPREAASILLISVLVRADFSASSHSPALAPSSSAVVSAT